MPYIDEVTGDRQEKHVIKFFLFYVPDSPGNCTPDVRTSSDRSQMDFGTLTDCCDCFWWCIIAVMPATNTNNSREIYYFIYKNKQLGIYNIWDRTPTGCITIDK